MLNKQGFNLWADHYDKTVQLSEESNVYPFAGYKEVLNSVFNEVMQKKHAKVLDIGFGTGILTNKIYENGHQVDGIDFSSKMISITQSKMPQANLIKWNISNGLPKEIKSNQYDFIISTYAMHHLTDDAKIAFISDLLSHLEHDGKIIIGDIAFKTRAKHDQCRHNNMDHWDSDEYYFVYDEIFDSLHHICNSNYQQISHCGGIVMISK